MIPGAHCVMCQHRYQIPNNTENIHTCMRLPWINKTSRTRHLHRYTRISSLKQIPISYWFSANSLCAPVISLHAPPLMIPSPPREVESPMDCAMQRSLLRLGNYYIIVTKTSFSIRFILISKYRYSEWNFKISCKDVPWRNKKTLLWLMFTNQRSYYSRLRNITSHGIYYMDI